MAAPSSRLGRLLHNVLAGVERGIDSTRDRLAGRSVSSVRVRVLAYAGYRNAAELRVTGRIVRWREPLDAGTGFVSRFRAMLAIYDSDELPGVAVTIDRRELTAETRSDEEGYFHFVLPLGDAHPMPAHTLWEQATLSVPGRAAQDGVLTVPILAPGADGKLGIISDIDDTILETGATNFLKNWRRVLIERPGRPDRGTGRRLALPDDRRQPRRAVAPLLLRLVEPVEPLRLPRRVHGAP